MITIIKTKMYVPKFSGAKETAPDVDGNMGGDSAHEFVNIIFEHLCS